MAEQVNFFGAVAEQVKFFDGFYFFLSIFFLYFYGFFFFTGQYTNLCGLYCGRPVSRVLNVLRVPASATIDGSWFQSLMDANIVHDQSGDAVKLARGLTRAMLWLRDLCMCLMLCTHVISEQSDLTSQ